MITVSSGANVVLMDTSMIVNAIKYFEPKIEVQAVINNNQGATLNLIARDANDNTMGQHTLYLAKNVLNAETMTGTGATAQAYSLFEKAAVTYLQGLSGNSGITFTIS